MSALAVFALVAAASAQEAPPIVGGSSHFGNSEVVFLYLSGGSTSGGTCTGTLISPTWVLTAAHCLDSASESASRIYVGNDIAGQGYSAERRVERFIQHPSWTGNTQNGGDIALVELESALGSVTPAVVNDSSLSSAVRNEDVTYMGFGVTSDTRSDSGTKRIVSVDVYDYDSVYLYTYDPGTNVCYGDSGGPAFIDTDDGYVLYGVNSFVWGANRPCSEGAGASTRVDRYLSWIEDYVDDLTYYSDVEGTGSDGGGSSGGGSDDGGGDDGGGDDGGSDGGGSSGGGSSDGGGDDGGDDGADLDGDASDLEFGEAEAVEFDPATCSVVSLGTAAAPALLAGLLVVARRRDD